MCIVVLSCLGRSPKIQYGVYPFVLVPFRLPVSYRIESLYPRQKKGGLPRLVPDSYLLTRNLMIKGFR